jgi:copper homeostasis protein
MSELDIEVHVLIRPRAGGFSYSKVALDIMLRDINYCKKIGCTGVVSGVLSAENNLDITATKRLQLAANGMEFTFHRAFDVVNNPLETLAQLEQLNVTRILSSGQQPKAIDGIELLKQLKAEAKTIQIMPGSGINLTNAVAFKKAGFDMIHFSAITTVEKPMGLNGVSFSKGMEGVSDEKVISEIISLMN